MSAALKLFDDLGIRFVPPEQQRQRGACETSCLRIVDRIILKHGLPHATITLRTIVESSDGNQSMLVADVVQAVSDLILVHPRWANLGLEWLAAFDKIDLAEIRKTAKAANVQPLRVGIATLIAVELEKILGPSKLPKPPRIKREPKPPRALTRAPEVEKNVALGVELLALRSRTKSNREFGRLRDRLFDVDTKRSVQCMMVARAYAERPEIYRRLSWKALRDLASPSLPVSARQDLERRILAGESIGGPDIVRARGPLKTGRPRRRADRSAMRMAA
jgi:hypothetical protein